MFKKKHGNLVIYIKNESFCDKGVNQVVLAHV